MTIKPIVTISIMISGEIDNVKRCLDSIQPILKRVPSELILTDTGCTADVRKLIEGYTKHIIDFKWCKDFSAARNVGLKEAKGEWFLYVDDDEWFENTDAIVDFFLSEESKKYNVAYYTQRNYLTTYSEKETILVKSLKRQQYVDNYVDRIIRIKPGVHFEHRVHEAYTGINIGKKKKINSFVHHYGYVYTDEQRRLEKYERNNELLKLECKEHPDDMRMWFQLVNSANSYGDWDESIRVSKKAISLQSDSAYWDLIHINILSCLLYQEKWEELIDEGENYLTKSLYPYGRFGVYQYLMKAYWKKSMYSKILMLAKETINIYEDYKIHPEAYDKNQLLDNRLWQKDRVSTMILIIIGAAYRMENEEINNYLIKENLRDDLLELYNNNIYKPVLTKMVLGEKLTNKKITMLENMPFGTKNHAEYWGSAMSELLEDNNEKVMTCFERPSVEYIECEKQTIDFKECNKQLVFSNKFFEGESRNEFYIEPLMKNAWAAEIRMLEIIGQICKKNKLRYYVDWGTLLGTVRHKGFIPWDDDIDICMPRNDMLQLAQIIENQYTDLKFSDIYNHKDHGMKVNRIMNKIDLLNSRDDLKDNYGFPLPTGIDIFVLDNLPDDDYLRTEMKEIHTICIMAYNLSKEIKLMSIISENYFEKIRWFKSIINKLEELCNMKFSSEIPDEQEILILLDEVESMYRNEKCKDVTQMSSYRVWDYKVSKEAYESTIMMPFENIMVPVPIGYDEILRKKYGDDYMIPQNKASGHDYPFYDKLFSVLHEKNISRSLEELKKEIILSSSEYYRKFINQKSIPILWYNEDINNDEKDSRIRMAESEVIAEINRICEKHNFKVYLLNDSVEKIHLGMFREDFMNFLTILPEELDTWFDYRDLYHDENHEDLCAYIVTDSYKTELNEYSKRFHGCSCIVGIYIWPIDSVIGDEQKENIREMLFENLVTTARYMSDKPPYGDDVLQILQEWRRLAKIEINERCNLRNEFMKSADTVASSCKDNDSLYVKNYADGTLYERKKYYNAKEYWVGKAKVYVPI